MSVGSSHVRSLRRRLKLRHHGLCLGSWLPKGYQVGRVGSKAIDFYAFSWVFLGNQHAIWSKQHNGKVRAERYQRYRPSRYAEDDPRILQEPDEMIPTTILYFGDFDPSGEDMVRSLGERLRFFGVEPVIKKCALTADDVTRYQLPPDFTKATDTRRAAFVEKYGDIAVELDALPIDVLRARLVEEVEALMDLDRLADVRRIEEEERRQLADALRNLI